MPLFGAHGLRGGLQNLIWGNIYSYGWLVAPGVGNHLAQLTGWFLWPLLVLAFFYFSSGLFWLRVSARWRFMSVVFLIVSLLVVLPDDTYQECDLWRSWPTWWSFSVVAY